MQTIKGIKPSADELNHHVLKNPAFMEYKIYIRNSESHVKSKLYVHYKNHTTHLILKKCKNDNYI